MTVKSAQAVIVLFSTANATTGAAEDATVGPAGTLYVDGVANAAVVTVTNITTGVYKAALTLPALTAGQIVSLRIAATVATIAAEGVVWQDVADTYRASDIEALVDDIKTDTAAILLDTGTDGVVLNAAGLDADAAAEIAAAVQTYATRTLTQSAASVLAAVTGSTLNVVRGRTYDATLTGMTIQDTWTGVKFTAKRDASDADAAALLQLVVTNPAASTDGVLYIEGAAATAAQRLQGSLTVDQAAGTVTIHLQDDLTAVLALLTGYRYDLTEYYTDDGETKSVQLTRGMWTVSATETAALA